jgi:hypothetical protein
MLTRPRLLLVPATSLGGKKCGYGKVGSAEHLFALINVCLLIERHKRMILALADSTTWVTSRGSAWAL